MKDALGNVVNWEKTVFLKHFITKDFISVGDYTYYDCSFTSDDPRDFENTNVLYFPTNNTKLSIGKFCMLANKCKFMMNGAMHPLKPLTTYPLFLNFIDSSKNYFETIPGKEYYTKVLGSTLIGNDVWIGYDAFIMPGVTIGSGAIIGSKTVVTKDVKPYEIVVGNPGTAIKKRFDEETINKLLDISWWDFSMDRIMHSYQAIMDGRVNEIE